MANPYQSKDTQGNKLRAKAKKMAHDSGSLDTTRTPTTSPWAKVPEKARGGSVYTGGAETGVGRLEKAKKYGA